MKDEEVVAAVYDAAVDYIYSVVPPKRIGDLEVAVALEDNELVIDITLITDRGEAVDQKTVDEAIKVASEKAGALLEKR